MLCSSNWLGYYTFTVEIRVQISYRVMIWFKKLFKKIIWSFRLYFFTLIAFFEDVNEIILNYLINMKKIIYDYLWELILWGLTLLGICVELLCICAVLWLLIQVIQIYVHIWCTLLTVDYGPDGLIFTIELWCRIFRVLHHWYIVIRIKI